MPSRKPRSGYSKGVTLVEMALVVAITSIIALVLGRLLMSTSSMATKTDLRVRADVALRQAMDQVTSHLINANQFLVATTTEALFIADMNTDPNYDRNGDFDGDGIPNYMDPDVDNDATLIQPPTAQWRSGYNLKDDDDDNDGKIDMRWRIYLATAGGVAQNALYLDYSKNEEAWGRHVQTLLTHVVSTGVFTYYGSENDFLSPGATGYDSNNNGLVSMSEIDAVANGGNGDGQLDTTRELNAIVTISVTLDQDVNRDRVTDGTLTTEVLPPPLYLKRQP